MRPMRPSLGGYWRALWTGWLVLGASGLVYARGKGIPAAAALPALAAFLLEYAFYLATGFEAVRERLRGRAFPALLAISALAPYLVFSLSTGTFHWDGCVRLGALTLALGLWYVVLPVHPATDLSFLGLIAAVTLGRYLEPVYHSTYPGLQIQVLAALALLHAAILVLLVERRLPGIGYGFLPTWLELRAGVLHFLYFLPVGALVGLGLKVVSFHAPAPWWKTAGLFVGMLWVVALSEEFFFRGCLWSWIEEWTGSRLWALCLTSVLFGSVHLWFRGFPNWRFSLLAAVAGFFYGRARIKGGGIRAGMITHALVVTLWRATSA
jgi:uncharacterized protein